MTTQEYIERAMSSIRMEDSGASKRALVWAVLAVASALLNAKPSPGYEG